MGYSFSSSNAFLLCYVVKKGNYPLFISYLYFSGLFTLLLEDFGKYFIIRNVYLFLLQLCDYKRNLFSFTFACLEA